jgi:cytochrome c oxidase assembly factor CtaG
MHVIMTTRQFLISAWSWQPAAIGLCALVLAAYAWLKRFQFSARSLFLLAAVLVLFLAMASPIAALANGYLFSAHMLQHLLLQLIVPPLLLLSLQAGGSPKPEGRRPKQGRNPKSEWAEPRLQEVPVISAEASEPSGAHSFASNASAPPPSFGLRISAFFRPSDFGLRAYSFCHKALSTVLRRPLLTWPLGLGAMWVWHVPSLCSASATNTWVHLVQGASLLVLGAAFWWPIIGPARSQWLPPLLGVLYLFSACVGCTILGIILTFAPLGVCPVFHHPADPLGILPLLRDDWGLSPAKDQQLGGLLMWVPPCFVYMCGIFGLLARWYAGPDPELAGTSFTEIETNHPGLAHAQPLQEKA